MRKAFVEDHGTAVGWLDHYGDGQAVFDGSDLVTDHLVFDGATRNEDDWTDTSAYGSRSTESFYSNTANYGSCASHVTIRYVDVGGTLSTSHDEAMPGSAFNFGGFDEPCTHWTISRVFAHNVGIVGQMAGVDSILWEYSWLGLNWSKEILRSQIQGSNVTIRHNIFKDGCRDDHARGTGCTAEPAFFGNAGSDDENYDNARIYGMNEGCEATTCDNNTAYATAPPFVDVAAGDFHLTEALAGASLGAPFDTNLDGTTRGADGTWDQGGFEYP